MKLQSRALLFSSLFFGDLWSMWVMLAGVAGLMGVLLTISALISGNNVAPGALDAFVLLQAVLLMFVPAAGIKGFAQSQRVLIARLSPHAALKQASVSLTVALLSSWLMAALPLLMMQGLVSDGGAAQLGSGIAWLALVLMVVTLVSASWWGMLNPIWLLPPVAASLGLMTVGWAEFWPFWRSAWPLHLATLLALPLCMHYALLSAPRTRAAEGTPQGWIRQRFQALEARWHGLDARQHGGFGPAFWVPQIFIQAFGNSNLGSLVPQADSPHNAFSFLARLLTLTLVTCTLLQSRDLHWRRLLMPGGAQRSAFGLRVLVSSLKGIFGIMLVLTPLIFALNAWISPKTWLELLPNLPGLLLPLLAELCLVTVLAVAVRGYVGSLNGCTVGLLSSLVALALVWFFGFEMQVPAWMPSWHRDEWHVAGCLLLSVLLLPLVRHAWLRADLTRLVRARAKKSDESSSED